MEGIVARRYAAAFFDLACEMGQQQRLLEEMQEIGRLFEEEPAYGKLLAAPTLSGVQKHAMVDEAFGGWAHPMTVNFLKLLCDKGRVRGVPDIARDFKALYNEANHIAQAVVTTAVALEPASRQKLEARLEKLTGKRVEADYRVDPAILGGAVVEIDGREMKDTLQGRLEEMRRFILQIDS